MIKRVVLVSVCIGFFALCVNTESARSIMQAEHGSVNSFGSGEFIDPRFVDPGLRDRYTAAQVDTFCLVWYDFEQMTWQGWTQKDNTAQEDTFSHVDDFCGLGGGPGEGWWPSRARSLCGAARVTG